MLVLDQPMLILDEPTMGQSYSDNWALCNLLTKINKENGVTPFIITHDMRVTAEFVNTAVVMSLGKILFVGPVRELFRKTEILEESSLYEPPIVHLSKRLHKLNHKIPEVLLSSDELVSVLRSD
jgi:energy-coupling factor transport system ATP-binding protein